MKAGSLHSRFYRALVNRRQSNFSSGLFTSPGRNTSFPTGSEPPSQKNISPEVHLIRRNFTIHGKCRYRGLSGQSGVAKENVDCVVIGGGVVGLAVARKLAELGREVAVLDAAGGTGTGTSSRNSEVIHAGIYYPLDLWRYSANLRL